MTHSSSTGGSFRGLSNYLEAEQKMEWKETRNLPGRNREEDLRLMDEVARMSRAEQPVYHLSLNYADADTPTRAQMIADGDQVLEELGLGGHQTMMVAHRDTGHRHLHLMVNRVHPDKTRAWNTWRDRTRIKDILGELERQRGYQRVSAGREWERAPGLELSDGEFKQLGKRGMEHPPLAVKVEMIGDEEMMREAGSWEEIQQELAKDGLGITDKNRGGVVKDLRTNKTIKLSRIHRDHSFGKLEQRFGKFREYERAFPGAAIGGRGGDRAGPESRPQGRKGRRADGKEERKHRRAGIFILRRLCLFGRTGRGLHDLSAAVVLLVNALIFLLSLLPINRTTRSPYGSH